MNPVLVNDWRGTAIECVHRGAVSVVDSVGRPVFALGDVQRPMFPRSAIKFLQAIPLVESGALEHYSLDERHLALACASHNGEPEHESLLNAWLAQLGLTEQDLECGASLPTHQPTRFERLRLGQGPSRSLHQCSGKHTGMISTCVHLKESPRNYRLYNHSAQRRVFDVLEQMTNTRVQQSPWGYDGCGIPAICMPLQRVAIGMARFAAPAGLPAARRQAIETIHAALHAQPGMVAGTDRACTVIMQQLSPQVFVKVGADGVYTASLPGLGYGVALKIDDGSGRASRVVLGVVLRALGVVGDEHWPMLAEHLLPDVTNSRGDVVGRVEPSTVCEQAFSQ